MVLIPYSPFPYSLATVPSPGTLPPPYPPSTKGCKFPSKTCRLFVTRLESTTVENFSPPISPAS
jgi:hypothetical protein